MAETQRHLCRESGRLKVHYRRPQYTCGLARRSDGATAHVIPWTEKKLGSKCQMDTHNIISGKTSIFSPSPTPSQPPQMLEK